MQHAISISVMPRRLSNTYSADANTDDSSMPPPIIDTETVYGVICLLRLTFELELSPGTAHWTRFVHTIRPSGGRRSFKGTKKRKKERDFHLALEGLREVLLRSQHPDYSGFI